MSLAQEMTENPLNGSPSLSVKDERIRGFFFSELLLELPKSLLIPLLADLLTESEGTESEGEPNTVGIYR
jgi:hypothetical protein